MSDGLQDALRAYMFYASNAGGLAHVRSLRASNQTAEIPGQARNDGKRKVQIKSALPFLPL